MVNSVPGLGHSKRRVATDFLAKVREPANVNFVRLLFPDFQNKLLSIQSLWKEDLNFSERDIL
jgi:hypothetical protein